MTTPVQPLRPILCALHACTLIALAGFARNVALLLNDHASWYFWATLPFSVLALGYAVRCTWRLHGEIKKETAPHG